MRHFRVTVLIDCPVERVWDVMSDVERWHEWTASVTRIRRLGDGALATGSRALIRQPRFPPARWTVTEFSPPWSFTWETGGAGVRVFARHTVDPADAGSLATLSLEYRGWLGGIVGWATSRITERYLSMEAAGLKARSEDAGFHLLGAQSRPHA